MSLPLAIVALSLLTLVLVPVLAACQEVCDAAYYATLLRMWNIQDKLHIFLFRHKTHKDTQRVNRSITALEAMRDPTDVPEPHNLLQPHERILYTQPPVRSNHVRNPMLRSTSRVHPKQGRPQHRGQRRERQERTKSHRQRNHSYLSTPFHLRIA